MERQYHYRPRWTVIAFCALFFGAGALVLGAKAAGNDRGLVVGGLVELSPDGATVFLWAFAALSAGFVLIAGVLAVARLTLRQRIALTDTGITVPRSRWSGDEVTVPFGEIVELSTSEVSGQRFLKLVHDGGKFTLVASLLPRRGDFDEICAAVREGVRAARSRAH